MFLIVAFVLAGCESMEDTYSEFAGNGKKRYVGKCEEFTVETGWKRFVFHWKQNSDPAIKDIKIVWKSDRGEGSWTVPADQNTFTSEATFENLNYTFECYGVDAAGNLSLPTTQYARPFTQEHEAVSGFSKMVNKHYFIGSNVALLFDIWPAGITSASISYYEGGEPKTIELASGTMTRATQRLIQNVDTDKDVVLNRVGEVAGCIDPVTFAPYVLDPEILSFNFDFMQQVCNRYNLRELTPEFVKSLEVLEIDYSLNSLEDILYFTNLKKVVLAKNRYMRPDQTASAYSVFINPDTAPTVFAFNTMHNTLGMELDLFGPVILQPKPLPFFPDVWNAHFLPLVPTLTWLTRAGFPELPNLSYLDTVGWTVTSSTSGVGLNEEDPAHPETILDDDPSTIWTPVPEQITLRTHELTIDMKSDRTVNGFKVTQALNNTTVQGFYSGIISIQLSMDNVNFEEAFYQTQCDMGTNYGESTVLRMPASKQARYVKIKIADKVVGTGVNARYNTCLGDFMIF